ncbi:MAG: hypothetical protein LBD22_02970, partial [Spirochaetaceae bacterium]|nr:hypothetical protein [Spirochaetaceae bacterium]
DYGNGKYIAVHNGGWARIAESLTAPRQEAATPVITGPFITAGLTTTQIPGSSPTAYWNLQGPVQNAATYGATENNNGVISGFNANNNLLTVNGPVVWQSVRAWNNSTALPKYLFAGTVSNTAPDTQFWGQLVHDIVFDSNHNVFVMAGSTTKISMSADGLTWNEQTPQITGNLTFVFFDGEKVIAGGQYGMLQYTTDGGVTWHKSSQTGKPGKDTGIINSPFLSPYNAMLGGHPWKAAYNPTTKRSIIVGQSGRIGYSEDGYAWQSLPDPNDENDPIRQVFGARELFNVAFSDDGSTVVIVGASGIIYRGIESASNPSP